MSTPTDTERGLALVTGASSGIGFELARQLAQRGFDLVVTAEDAELEAAAGRLREEGAAVRWLQVDLRTHEGVESLWREATGGGVAFDVVALNAGVGAGRAFLDQDLQDVFDVIDLNVTGTVHLAKLVLGAMVQRGCGRVLVTSSVASTMPGSYQAIYNASKSFVQSFTEALQDELEDSDVTITSLMPGPTDTEFFHRADLDDTPMGRGPQDDPADVAEQGLDALFAGDRKVVAANLLTKVQGRAAALVPDRLKAATHRAMAKPDDA